MKISQVSRLTGASPKAIRHYEQIGLLNDIERQGTYRRYSNRHVNLVRLIRIAQTLGFRLSEMTACVKEGGALTWGDVLTLIQHKQKQVSQQIEELTLVNNQLNALITELGECGDAGVDQIDMNDIECELFLTQFPLAT